MPAAHSIFSLLSRPDALFAAYIIAQSEKPVSSREIRRRARARYSRSERTVRHWLTRLFDAGLVSRRYHHAAGGYLYLTTDRLSALLEAAGVNTGTFLPRHEISIRPADPSRFTPDPPWKYRHPSD